MAEKAGLEVGKMECGLSCTIAAEPLTMKSEEGARLSRCLDRVK